MAHVQTSAWGRTVPAQRTSSYDEVGLLRAAALGDGGAWDALIGAHGPDLWRAALTSGRTADEAVALCDLAWRRAAERLRVDREHGWLRRELWQTLHAEELGLTTPAR